MKYKRDERRFDFHDIGLEIKRRRKERNMTQEQLAAIIDRDPALSYTMKTTDSIQALKCSVR